MLVGRYDGADGMKTGFVCASGFNMIGSATRDGKTLVAVVLGRDLGGRPHRYRRGASRPRFPGEHGAQGSTVATLPAYGLRGASPADMREEICGKKKPAAAQSEAARRSRGQTVEIALAREDAQPEARHGRRSAARPGRSRWRGATSGEEYADVPIPTPRPDYPRRQGGGAGRHGRQLGAASGTAFPSPSRC